MKFIMKHELRITYHHKNTPNIKNQVNLRYPYKITKTMIKDAIGRYMKDYLSMHKRYRIEDVIVSHKILEVPGYVRVEKSEAN